GWALKPRASIAATTPRISSAPAFCRTTTSMSTSSSLGETALPTAVEKVDHESGRQPQHEALPREQRQAGHQEEAHGDAREGGPGDEGNAELPRPLRLPHAQDQDADRDQHEREQGADVGELYD